jgi:hypothetical protein
LAQARAVNFLLLLEKLETSAGLTGSTEKNSGLKSLIFQKQQNVFLRINKNHFSCKNKNQLRSFSCSDVSNGGLTLDVSQKKLARLEKLVKKNSQD